MLYRPTSGYFSEGIQNDHMKNGIVSLINNIHKTSRNFNILDKAIKITLVLVLRAVGGGRCGTLGTPS